MQIFGFEVKIIKKNIKSMNLKLDKEADGLIITCPYGTSVKTIENFIIKNLKWINKAREVIKNKKRVESISLENNIDLYVFGKAYKLILVEGKAYTLVFDDNKIIFAHPELCDSKSLEEKFSSLLKKILMEKIESYIKKWSQILGVSYHEVRIKKMKTRWGTCNVKDRRIWINFSLVHREERFLEYVIVHELVHLLEASHNKRFKELMTCFLPDWKERKEALNTYKLE